MQAAPVAAEIQHDAIQPAFEASVIAQSIKGEIGLQQGFLYQFVRDFSPFDQPQREIEGQRLIAFDQAAKGVRVISSRTGDELSISFFFQGESNLSSPNVSIFLVVILAQKVCSLQPFGDHYTW